MRRLLPFACVLLLALLGPVSGWAGASSPPPNAGQLLSQALSAAGVSGSMHFVDKTTAGKLTQELRGSLSAPTAGETLSGAEPLEVELINGTIYVSGSSAALQSALQLSGGQATAAANKWIVVQQADPPFSTLSGSLTVQSEVDGFAPTRATAQLGKKAKVHGISVYPISGRPLQGLPKGSSASVALFVAVKAPHLPVGATLVIASSHTKTRLHEEVAFTDWGQTVNLTPPSSDTIPYSTVAG